jgi:hypothetical protein
MTEFQKKSPGKQKVTLSIDREVWKRFMIRVIWDKGRQKVASQVIQELIEKYLERGQVGTREKG